MKPLLPTATLSGLRETVAELGGDFGRIVEESGLPASLFDQRDGVLPTRKVQGMANLAARLLRRPDFGLLWGARSDLGLLGPLSIALMHAPTPRIAMNLASQHLSRVNPVLQMIMSRHEGAGLEILSLRNTMLRPPSIVHTMERNMVIFARLLKAMCGPEFRPREIWLVHAQSGSDAAYRRAFGAVPKFEQGACAFVMRSRDLDGRIAGRNSQMFEMAEQYLRTGSGGVKVAESRLVETVRVLLRSADYSVLEVSQVLGVHGRTMQRHLRNAGFSFAGLKDEAKRDQAERLLATSDDSLTQIAQTLGYADLPAFSHSCRRWFGVSPSVVRERLKRSVRRAEVQASRTHPLLVARRLRDKPEGA